MWLDGFLLNWGVQCDSCCVLRNCTWESSEHLFLHYSYLKIMWEGLLAKLFLQPTKFYSYYELVSFVVGRVDPSCGGLIFVAHLLLPAFVCHIWRERNARVFSQNSKRPKRLLHGILHQIYSRLVFLNVQLPDPFSLWSLPPITTYKPIPSSRFLVYNGQRFSIVHLHDSLTGILKDPNGKSEFAAMRQDTIYYKEIIYLMGLIPLQIRDLCFEMEDSLYKALQKPFSSPWHHRFEFRHLAFLI